MFMDLKAHGEPHSPRLPQCKSCKRPIAEDHLTQEVRFEADPVHGLDDMNGTYHQECAKAFLSIARALKALSRFGR